MVKHVFFSSFRLVLLVVGMFTSVCVPVNHFEVLLLAEAEWREVCIHHKACRRGRVRK